MTLSLFLLFVLTLNFIDKSYLNTMSVFMVLTAVLDLVWVANYEDVMIINIYISNRIGGQSMEKMNNKPLR